jgi:hypothetical protein
VALTVSSDEQTLYVIGYILDSNGDPLYMIHKYGGLKVVGPYFDAIEDYTLSAGSTFYTTDAMNYLTKPSDFYPSRIVVSSDGKYAYILTASTDSISGGSSGGPILVYDLEYMNQLPNIDAEDTKFDISAASEKIVFAPTPDYDWLGQFAIDPLPVFDTTVIYPKKFYPQNGSYADYLAEYFIIDVAFTEYLDNSTVTNETFWVTDDDDNIVPGHAGAASAMAFFSPYSLLENNTDYVAHLSKNITSKTGKPLYSDVEWSFTTKNNSDPTSSSSTTIDLSLIEPLIPVPLGTFVIVPPSDSSETNQSTNQTEPNPTNSTTINQTAEESTPVETTQTAEQIEPQQSEETQTSSETISENAPEAMITPIETTNSSANGAGVGNQSGNPDEQEGIGDLSHVGEETQLNPQPEPPTPLASVVEFFKWLFGVKYVMP